MAGTPAKSDQVRSHGVELKRDYKNSRTLQ
jgi:hypothetical protein